jgi:hypothetical protein
MVGTTMTMGMGMNMGIATITITSMARMGTRMTTPMSLPPRPLLLVTLAPSRMEMAKSIMTVMHMTIAMIMGMKSFPSAQMILIVDAMTEKAAATKERGTPRISQTNLNWILL